MRIKDLFKKKEKQAEEDVIKLPTDAEMLQKIMEKKHYDQQHLARILKVDKSQITRWLNGSTPKIENRRRIKNLYDEVMQNENK